MSYQPRERALRHAATLRAGEPIWCPTPAIAFSTIKSVRSVLEEHEAGRLRHIPASPTLTGVHVVLANPEEF